MAYKYSIFNPTESKMANELLNTPASALVKRYIKKKNDKPTKFFTSVKEVVNSVDDEDYLINPYLYLMEGANLNFVATQVYIPASQLIKMGYEFKIENVIRDLDKLFGEHKTLVNKISADSPVQTISKDIAYFFVTDILTDKIIKTLESNLNSNVD